MELVESEVIANATSVSQGAFLYPDELAMAEKHNTSWYRTKEKAGGTSPFASYMMNKKWILEEEFNNHMLRFQQVTVSLYYFCKIHFDLLGWIDNC